MEREYKPPAGPPKAEAPKTAPSAEQENRRPKREKPSKPESAEPTEKPHKQKFGERVMNLLFGEKQTREPGTPEGPPRPSPEAPGTASSPFEAPGSAEFEASAKRASRIRRFASRVIGHVFSEAAAEPGRARAEHAPPLNTEPLNDAAEDLRSAADGLGDTLHDAEEKAAHQPGGAPNFAAESSPDFGGGFTMPSVAERLAQRVERLESRVESANGLSIAATGLGVVAVLIAGHEYFARKRHEKQSGRQHKELNRQLREQQRELAGLQQENVAAMGRQQRQDYYNRLSEFTHEQAATTREANRDLREKIEAQAALPVPEPLPEVSIAPPLRASQTIERQTFPEPLRRVETADTVERNNQPGNAGNGFFGGGMVGGIGTRLQQAITGKQATPGQLGQKELEAAARRRAQLASNAWLYSVGFVVAVAALVLSLVFAG